jgi:hypothetical protein
MKHKIILLAFLFVSINGWSQDSTTVNLSIIRLYDSSVIKYDTVKVIMLICDTFYGLKPNGLWVINGNRSYPDSSYRTPNLNVWYEWGYKVLKFIPDGWGDWDRQIFHHWEHLIYLDENKQPLSKNIIIWQSQLLK